MRLWLGEAVDVDVDVGCKSVCECNRGWGSGTMQEGWGELVSAMCGVRTVQCSRYSSRDPAPAVSPELQ